MACSRVRSWAHPSSRSLLRPLLFQLLEALLLSEKRKYSFDLILDRVRSTHSHVLEHPIFIHEE